MEHPNRSALEAQFTRRIASLSEKQMSRYISLLGSPPDVENVPASFWEAVERENADELLAVLLLIFLASASFHGAKRSDILPEAQRWAARESKSLARQFTRTSSRMADVMGRDIEVRNRGDGASADFVSGRAGIIFGRERVERLAVNETTIAQTEGGEAGIKVTVGISDDDRWRNNPSLSRTGPCPICRPLNGKKRLQWGEFTKGPPAHVSCVCDIVYANLPELRPIRRR